MKVKGISEESIRRSSLSKFKQVLLIQFQNGKVTDFYSGELLDSNDISIDHVIPWSFMYSDDIWNLEINSKSHNSRKSNTQVGEDVIQRLKERNSELIETVPENYRNDIITSIKLRLLEKFYFQFKL
jgi:CRISPR/Cas system Type II protein with McrA/HNH and RuvC-like nuclease domain